VLLLLHALLLFSLLLLPLLLLTFLLFPLLLVALLLLAFLLFPLLLLLLLIGLPEPYLRRNHDQGKAKQKYAGVSDLSLPGRSRSGSSHRKKNRLMR
jgi:hypothetical protein